LKLKELSIYSDLIRLPLPVLVKRLYKRFFNSGKELTKPEIPEGLILSFSGSQKNLTLKPDEQSDLESLCKQYKNFEFNYLGSGWVSIRNNFSPKGFSGRVYGTFPRRGLTNESPDWNRDQRTGFQYETGTPSLELSKAFNTKGVDAKFSWEFARMHHLPQLGILGVKSRSIIEEHLKPFDKQCPFSTGIHWSSNIEVSIRLVNILVALDLTYDTDQPEKWLKKLIYEHWFFIKENLEHKEGYGTNHYLSNLMALVVSGCYIDGDNEVNKTKVWALTEFEKELGKQFFSDGGNFEYSTYYHRLSTEIALVTYAYGIRSGYQFNQQTRSLLAKAVSFIEAIIKDDGTLPNFGDNDSSRVLDLLPYVNNKEPRPEKSGYIKEIYLGINGKSKSLYQQFFNRLTAGKGKLPALKTEKKLSGKTSSNNKLPSHKSIWEIPYSRIDTSQLELAIFPETGLYIFKSDEFYLAVNLMANPKGHRYRGHSHNDKGAFELRVNNEDKVVDAGTLSYTASVEIRNQYRSTKAHPVAYAGLEQNRYLNSKLGLFHSILDTTIEILELSRKSLLCCIRYRGVVNYRKFDIYEDKLVVTDWCNKPFEVTKKYSMPVARAYGRLK